MEQKTYKVAEDEAKKKFYVLNMFPYPSGAGLYVGHPLGYIASDIYAPHLKDKTLKVGLYHTTYTNNRSWMSFDEFNLWQKKVEK